MLIDFNVEFLLRGGLEHVEEVAELALFFGEDFADFLVEVLEEQGILLVVGYDLLVLVDYLLLLLEDGAGEPLVVLVLLDLVGERGL